jgi:hypothetical protein
VRRKSSVSIDHAQQSAKPIETKPINIRPVNQQAGDPPVLLENPPQIDEPFAISQKFSKFAPDLPITFVASGTSAAGLEAGSGERTWKSQPPTGLMKSTQSPSMSFEQGSVDAINDKDDLRFPISSAAQCIRLAPLPYPGEEQHPIYPKRHQVARISDDCNVHSSSRSRRMPLSMHGKVMSTPSDRLLAALPQNARKAWGTLPRNKVDLSYISPRWESLSRTRRRTLKVSIRRVRTQSYQQQFPGRISLREVLSRYLAARRVSKDRAIEYLSERETTDYLRSKGYDADHVFLWSRILSSTDANQMVSTFVATANDLSSSEILTLPTFLLMFMLRARSLSANSIRLLLDYIWKHYVGKFQGSKSLATTQTIGPQTGMILAVRLIRHARIAWPSVLAEIATIVTELIGRESEEAINLSHRQIQNFSHIYNRLLSLFALPTSLQPFLSASTQQRAQFCLIRKMTSFTPHLPVTREGFRALIKVQLARKKTEAERKWSQSQALSWPPWKEERLGIETDREVAGKVSRAAEFMAKMTEAGYSMLHWEKAARILAGWDTDGSPTILTRTLIRPGPITLTADVRQESKESHHDDHETWAARILATRIHKEAWACFTSYESSCCGIHAAAPYNAMLAKLLHVRKDTGQSDNKIASVVPGDCKESWPEPTSPHDFLYVPSSPPTIDEFFDLMTKRGLRPAKYVLVDLLDQAETLAVGMKYIDACKFQERTGDCLLGRVQLDASLIRAIVKYVPNGAIAAFVRLLGRMKSTQEITFALPTVCDSLEADSTPMRTAEPFQYAQSFVFALQPCYGPIWYALFHGMRLRLSLNGMKRQSLSILLNLVYKMDAIGVRLDFDAFQAIGLTLERILVSNHLVMTHQGQECNITVECVSLCKSLFAAMAYGGSVQSENDVAKSDSWLALKHSQLVHTPSAAVLHRTIRILGFAEDDASILTLLRWMHSWAPHLASVADELANSKQMIRLALTAVRYFVETSWRHDEFKEPVVLFSGLRPRQKELLMEAKAIIEQHADDWGGWPTDEQVCLYHDRNRKTAGRLRIRLGLPQELNYWRAK